ncbi:unnamed protein product [Mycena citricolor]|uniref:Uncharacterized protein n=1 Tax=Mycena citricolor TaxID=2018698 RepID=A0AAD2Q0H7_9AGAR|nr:unnamed protein product [Mycena citricolor]CAK5262568.1 unnamed protein product [Mycena citricolor]
MKSKSPSLNYSAYNTCLSVPSIQARSCWSLPSSTSSLLKLCRYLSWATSPPNRCWTLSMSSICVTRGCTRIAMRSSATRSNILIFTNAVWGLAADIDGEFALATEPDRERDDMELECRDEEDGDVGITGRLLFDASAHRVGGGDIESDRP